MRIWKHEWGHENIKTLFLEMMFLEMLYMFHREMNMIKVKGYGLDF